MKFLIFILSLIQERFLMSRLFTGIFIIFIISFTPIFAHPGHTIEKTYNPSLDFLFVMDNSYSMTHKYKYSNINDILAKNAGFFIDHFSDIKFLDYHIGVTTSSTNGFITDHLSFQTLRSDYVYPLVLIRCEDLAEKQERDYSNYVERSMPKDDECFKEMMTKASKTQVGGSEHFLNIPLFTLLPMISSPQPSFYRSEAHLGIFVVTDTDDQSQFTPKAAYDYLKFLKNGAQEKLHYAAKIIHSERENCKSESPVAVPPRKLTEMVKLFGDRGYSFDLCQYHHHEEYLGRFANHLVDSVLSIPLGRLDSVSIPRLPDVDTIEVYYEHGNNKQRINEGWMYMYDEKTSIIRLSRDLNLESGGRFIVKYKM